MSSETLKTILNAEKDAEAIISAAAFEAKKILADAESESQQLSHTAMLEASEIARDIKIEANLNAAIIKRDIADRVISTNNSLRFAAEQKIQQAILLVVESIVRT